MHIRNRFFCLFGFVGFLAVLLLPTQGFANNDVPGVTGAQTSYIGARVLKSGEEVFSGDVVPGIYSELESPACDALEIEDCVQTYGNWEGDTFFFGATDLGTGNTVDGVLEFYWFESSVPKSADFYVMVLKVKSAPNAVDDWELSHDSDNIFQEWIYELTPCQTVNVEMESSGLHGAIRWDWSVPFQNYQWEPEKVIEIQETYSAGYDLNASASAQAKGAFKEGSYLKDATVGANIQGKGYVNQSYKVSSQYTVTLYKWQMLVQGGATNMTWNMVVTEDGTITNDSAYHEYFIVVQAPQGETAHIAEINIGAGFRRPAWWIWPDSENQISVSVQDVTFTPPLEIECYSDDDVPADFECPALGICAYGGPTCDEGLWKCAVPELFEMEEYTCDGLDNDCDGVVDEELQVVCETSCGLGTRQCVEGLWTTCSSEPALEVCDGLDNDCDGSIDESVKRDCETSCGNGTQKCTNGVWGECSKEPEVETCDGLDNNCDGMIDEALQHSCETACGTGYQFCTLGSWGECTAPQPTAEVCDSVDNDCDGKIDEGIQETCSSACGTGIMSCTNGGWGTCSAPEPIAEICGDGIDNDCNGYVDDGKCSSGGSGGGCSNGSGNGPIAWLIVLCTTLFVTRRRRSVTLS
ncbi:MAG: hypothetical protein CMH54_10930 [Myxococcales bacterium]|nr:hypothetical protein [Myxococcales bacterium]